jgi:hypothetical protein
MKRILAVLALAALMAAMMLIHNMPVVAQSNSERAFIGGGPDAAGFESDAIDGFVFGGVR